MEGQVSRTERAGWLFASIVLVSLPCLVVDYVPATDLPQHVAQIRLLEELWGLRPASSAIGLLEARPLGANTLVYWPMFLFARAFPLVLAGKLTVWLLLASSVLAIHALAARRARDPAHAMLASLTLFSAPLYWGFLNFLSGLPLFLWYLHTLFGGEPRRTSWRRLLAEAALIAGLFWAHVFWVVVAALSAGLHALLARDLRGAALRVTAFLPITLALTLWLPELVAARQRAGFGLGVSYLEPVPGRFLPQYLVVLLFGGIRGALEPLFASLLLVYVVWQVGAALRLHRLRLDPPLALLALLLALFAFAAPDQYFNTILFNRRFMPIAALLLLLSLPWSPGVTARTFSALVTCAFVVWTSLAWSLFDQVELAGLRESLARMPERGRVLGVDLRKRSPYLRARPFLQTFAYAQVEHGGELSFSFAEHASSVVLYRRPRKIPWTRGMEWYPERLQTSDLVYFDCLLVNASADEHMRMPPPAPFSPLVQEGFFRAYCRR